MKQDQRAIQDPKAHQEKLVLRVTQVLQVLMEFLGLMDRLDPQGLKALLDSKEHKGLLEEREMLVQLDPRVPQDHQEKLN